MSSHRTIAATLLLSLLAVAPAAAQYCGDYYCTPGEMGWCFEDCGPSACGDFICSPELGEDRFTCTTDCVCGDGLCSYGEDPGYCPGDCPPPPPCSPDSCTSCSQPSFGDADNDGVPDALEYELAHRFFPTIFLQNGPDIEVSYLHRGLSIPYTVQPLTSGMCNEVGECLEIRYGIAYDYDFGDNVWVIRELFSPPHVGDSEFYAVLVQRTAPWAVAATDSLTWQLIRDFTAAHWGEITDSSRMVSYGYCPPECSGFNEPTCRSRSQCSWFSGFCTGQSSQLGVFCGDQWGAEACQSVGCRWLAPQCGNQGEVHCYSTSPRTAHNVLYASERKHGLYHSDGECDSGAWGADECPSNIFDMRQDKAGKLQNIGGPGAQDHPASAFDLDIQSPDLCYRYLVWGGAKFGAATEYSKHFTVGINWNLPSATEGGAPDAGSNPFTYASPRDQFLACYGMAGHISSNCRDISELNDKQLCYAMSDHTQSPCTQMSDRNLQLACYGMSLAPSYPSNCRDITHPSLQRFCYGVAGSNSAECAAVTDPNARQLCYAMATRSSSYCAGITSANDRQFCYGVSTHTNAYCASIQ